MFSEAFGPQCGTINGWQSAKALSTSFPPAGRLTLSWGIWRMHQQKTWENTTPFQRCESFCLVLSGVLALPPSQPTQAPVKAVSLTDDSSWQNSAHPRNRGAFASKELDVNQACNFLLPQWKSQWKYWAVNSWWHLVHHFHQILSLMSRGGCVGKEYIAFLARANCLMEITNAEHAIKDFCVFYPQPCFKIREMLTSAQCSAPFSGAHLADDTVLRSL